MRRAVVVCLFFLSTAACATAPDLGEQLNRGLAGERLGRSARYLCSDPEGYFPDIGDIDKPPCKGKWSREVP